MSVENQSLQELLTWKALLSSAENSLGKNWDFYQEPEPSICDRLLRKYEDNKKMLVKATILLMETAVRPGGDSPEYPAWAVLKEGATLLHHLRIKGYKSGDNWEAISGSLWKILGEYAQGSWSDFYVADDPAGIPVGWKQRKFVIDAFLCTIDGLPRSSEDQIERFFNSKMSDYWKSYYLLSKEIWGEFQQDRETYYSKQGYRSGHKLTTYRLIAYRLRNCHTEFNVHPYKATEAFNYLKNFSEEIPAQRGVRLEIYYALFKYLCEGDEQHTLEEDFSAIRSILGDDDAFRFLTTHDNSLTIADRGRLLLSFKDLDDRWKSDHKLGRSLLPALLAALKHNDGDVRELASVFLKDYETELFKHLRAIERNEDRLMEEDSTEVFKKIARVFPGEVAEKLLNNIFFNTQEKGKFLLSTPRILEARWEAKDFPNHDDLLPFILAAVDNDQEPEVAEKATVFLKRKSSVIQKRLNELIKDLSQEEKASELISSAIKYGSDGSLKFILEQCVIWVASDKNATLVDQASQKARYLPGAVLALVDLLNNRKDLSKVAEVREYVLQKVLEEQKNPAVSRVFREPEFAKAEMDPHTSKELEKWCWTLKEKDKGFADLVVSHENLIRKPNGELLPVPTYELAKLLLNRLMDIELDERELVVQKWITKLLGEMSDRWFFEDKMETYNRIKVQLERLAIEPLSKRLPKEENIDIRENLVKILGNIGGRVAVDALVRTVTGEERERAARQELLSEYYLKPSKARSEEAAHLLNEAVNNAKKTMQLLQTLNVATFVMGAILIMGGVTIAVVSEELGGRLTGVLAGLGGLAAILTQFLKDPLERIQRAMADLVQVQTAFTSFVWELNLNGTYIQSQYVAEGVLTDFDLRRTIDRVDQAMERTMHLIQVYADGSTNLQPPRVEYLIPSFDSAGMSITLFGQSLKSFKTDKEKFLLAINHLPVEATLQMWSDQHATFNLDAARLQSYDPNARLWVSLLVNGEETNALPLTLPSNGKAAPS